MFLTPILLCTRCLLTDRNIDSVPYQVLLKVIFLTDRNTAPDVGLSGHLCTDSCTKNDEKGYFFRAGVCASLSPFRLKEKTL